MIEDVLGGLAEMPAWTLMDSRYKKMLREIERLAVDPHVSMDGRAWQNWIAWLEATMTGVDVTDEIDLFPLYNVILHGYRKIKFETSAEVQRAAAAPVENLVELRPDDARRMGSTS